MWRSMFSITTIASSTTSPVASVTPKSVSVLIEKPNSFTNMKVPMSDTGIVIAGLRPPDVLQADQRSVGRALQNDVVELARLGQSADRADADLILLACARGLRADLSGGDLHVLLAQRVDDFARGEAAGRKTVRV